MRTPEHFEIKRFARRYDRTTGNFIVNISYETATDTTPRTIAVAVAFGLGVDQHKHYVIYDNVELKIHAVIGQQDRVKLTNLLEASIIKII